MSKSEEPSWAKNADAGLRAGFEADASDPQSSVLARLERTGRSAPRLRLSGGAGGPDAPPEPGADRYEVLGEIARGGVGIVLKGRDVDLGRDVAMKVIRPEHADSDEILERFVEEAQIGGQLQHPGIVPVYEMGLRDDRRVFFTMKLIRGETLDAMLKGRSGPEDGLPRFLSIFEQVCQTMAYAHARGVVHRDLKPANILVGGFGEVQVVDWGFAKVLGRPEERREGESIVRTARSGSIDSASQAGAVMGTPAFMPPEQALGEVDQVDERSDVFSLGAILCQMLTGTPPYAGSTGTDVLVQAAQADLANAFERLDACPADAELVKLCRACLAQQRDDRPASAEVVARAVSGYLTSVQERARAAEVEAARAQVAAKAERKARKLTLGLAAAVFVAILTGGGAYLWNDQQRRARARESARVFADLKAEVARLSTAGRWEEALQAAARAVSLAAAEDVQRAERLRAETQAGKAKADRNTALLDKLESIRAGRGDKVDHMADNRRYAEAFAPFGIAADRAEADAAARIEDTGIQAEIAAFLDEWVWLRGIVHLPREHLLTVAREVDPDEWRNRLRAAAMKEDRDALMAVAVQPKLEGHSPNLLARHLSGVLERETAVAILRRAQRDRPDDFWINFELGFELTLLVPPRWQEAISFYRVALAMRPQSVQVLHELGIALFKIGHYDEAIDVWTDAVVQQRDYLHAYDHIIEAHESKGDLDALIARWRDAAERAPDDFVAQYKHGRACEAINAWDRVIASYRRALEIKPDSVLIHYRLGDAYHLTGDLERALATHKEGLELDPTFARSAVGVARVLHQQDRVDEAIASVQAAIRLNPYDPLLRSVLGIMCNMAGRTADAERSFREAIRVQPDATGHLHLGRVHMGRGELAAAVEELLKATEMPERNSENRFEMSAEVMTNPETGRPTVRPFLGPTNPTAHAFGALANAYAFQGRWRDAKPARLQALRRAKSGVWVYEFLVGHDERVLRDPEAAVVHFRNAMGDLRSKPQHPVYADTMYFLAFVELATGRFADGEKHLRAFSAAPLMASAAPERRRHWEAVLPDILALARELPAILAGTKEWSSPREQALAGWMLEDMGYLREAARLLSEALEAEPALAGEPVPYYQVWHYASYLVIATLALGYGDLDPDPEARKAWRLNAIEWMRKDLALWRKRGDDPRMLRQWLRNSIYGLARHPANLEAMPAEEREAWQAIWAEVRARLRRAVR